MNTNLEIVGAGGTAGITCLTAGRKLCTTTISKDFATWVYLNDVDPQEAANA